MEERSADTDTLLSRAHSVKRINGDAIVHEFLGKSEVGHSRILNGEVEAIGKRSTHIVVIHEIEAVCEKHVLHELSPATILLNIVEEVIATVASSLHKSSHSVLNAVSSAT